ncbi:diuretic hormone receptor-like [Tetranychus urticae]|uniref:G-protein coupled receptors family 2 profile 2 domain-containing protein n=1 Tax=Tetranychus urticae TaxID=32264 RepID=T1JQP4_TETUR|nr:diuretic hormone receptor-like [Tetranychus urticae]
METNEVNYNASEILDKINDDLVDCSYTNNSNDNGIVYSSTESTPIEVNGKIHCPPTWDRISCWPLTLVNDIAVIPCFAELNDVPYDTSRNASRMCLPNGFWAEKSDYSKCKALEQEIAQNFNEFTDLSDASIVYYFGYGLSIVALFIALAILITFKDLHCIRNTIHINLMLSYMFHALTWIATASLQDSSLATYKISFHGICFLYILLTYFTASSFFWMFLEGLYLYILVVRTFSIERINLILFALIGWGFPVILVTLWAPIKYLYPNQEDEETLTVKSFNCPWQVINIIDLIYICPISIVLVVNLFFLGVIIYVLVSKTRASEASQEFQQYRKAVKALLVLTPLLGIAYILLLVTPDSGNAKIVYTYIHATLNSTQGFTVAVLYCFLNAEVRNSLRYHIERWRNVRTLRHGDYPLPVNRTFSSRTLRGRKSEYRLRYTSSITRNPHHRCQSSYSSPPHLLITNQYNSKNVKNGSKVETQLIQSQSTNGTNKRNVFEEYL